MAEAEVEAGLAVEVKVAVADGDAPNRDHSGPRPRQANQRTLHKAEITSATPPATLVLDLGSPSAGLLWDVRQVVIQGKDAFEAVAGTSVAVVVSSEPSGAGPFATLSAGASGATPNEVPQTYSYGRHTCYVRTPNHLAVIINAPAASTQFVAVAYVLEEEDHIAWPGT